MPIPRGHICQSWKWDTVSKSPDACVSQCGQAVYFHISPLLESEGTAAVRGNEVTGFTHGEHYWEIEFLEPPYGTSVMVGVGTQNALLHAADRQFINLIGMDAEGWGLSYKGILWHNGKSKKYTEPFYEINTVIGVLLDCSAGTLTFYRNGENLGLAFSDLNHVSGALYPMVSSTTPETELQLVIRSSRLASLQELCIHTITHCLSPGHIHELPLPTALCRQICNYNTDILHTCCDAHT
ncbi:SPRY domain-containing SOCS box protein 3 isoform X3 [Ictalurus furcatus]|uniref:SPRY domain-containing SOCS box protein 3 isoform X3 n=1 Tax=Ictalurus furcatus TaxID=66913 RepID=UPI002350584D|nr:SPRY domain-containing SOCS box protein 3 isoform X3 [Ictalurus furcatus]XP_053472437.1 SPRY domain-containing SOCS box protein 3 isoform X3 [Ictalurus furcatus]